MWHRPCFARLNPAFAHLSQGDREMRTVAYWKAGAAVLGLSLLVYSPALAQTASGTAQPGAATRETNQNDNAVNRSGGSASTRTGAGAQSGQSGRQGGTATNRSQG